MHYGLACGSVKLCVSSVLLVVKFFYHRAHKEVQKQIE